MADDDPVSWNVDLEVGLFHAMKNHKPVGVNRHFHMAFIHGILNGAIHRKISSKQIWEHLNTLYDLRALNESEISPFPNKQCDFSLPSDFSPLMNKVTSKGPAARHDQDKESSKEKDKESQRDKESHKEKQKDSHKDSHKDKESHRDRDKHKERDSRDLHREKDSHKDRDLHKERERESLRDRHEREKESKSDKKSRKNEKDRDRDRDRSKSKKDDSPKGSRKRGRNLPDPSHKQKDEGGPTPKRARRI